MDDESDFEADTDSSNFNSSNPSKNKEDQLKEPRLDHDQPKLEVNSPVSSQSAFSPQNNLKEPGTPAFANEKKNSSASELA